MPGVNRGFGGKSVTFGYTTDINFFSDLIILYYIFWTISELIRLVYRHRETQEAAEERQGRSWPTRRRKEAADDDEMGDCVKQRYKVVGIIREMNGTTTLGWGDT